MVHEYVDEMLETSCDAMLGDLLAPWSPIPKSKVPHSIYRQLFDSAHYSRPLSTSNRSLHYIHNLPLTHLDIMSRPVITSASRTLLSPTSLSSRYHPIAPIARYASASTPPSSSSSRPSSSQGLTPLPLTWPDYLSFRRERRMWSTLTTVPTTFAGLFLGGGYFASIEADPSQLIMGLEPM